MKNLYRILTVGLLLFCLSAWSSAHTFWLESTDQGAHLFLGDAADDEVYEEDSILDAGGLTANGDSVSVEKNYNHGHMHIVSDKASLLWVKADYGFWRKTSRGWQEGSKQDSGRTIDSAWHLQYAKLLKGFQSSQNVGLELEIVVDEVGPKKLKCRVLKDGAPLSRVPIYLAHRKVARSDSQGRFEVKRRKGRSVISAVVKRKLENHPHADNLILTSTLTLDDKK